MDTSGKNGIVKFEESEKLGAQWPNRVCVCPRQKRETDLISSATRRVSRELWASFCVVRVSEKCLSDRSVCIVRKDASSPIAYLLFPFYSLNGHHSKQRSRQFGGFCIQNSSKPGSLGCSRDDESGRNQMCPVRRHLLQYLFFVSRVQSDGEDERSENPETTVLHQGIRYNGVDSHVLLSEPFFCRMSWCRLIGRVRVSVEEG